MGWLLIKAEVLRWMSAPKCAAKLNDRTRVQEGPKCARWIQYTGDLLYHPTDPQKYSTEGGGDYGFRPGGLPERIATSAPASPGYIRILTCSHRLTCPGGAALVFAV